MVGLIVPTIFMSKEKSCTPQPEYDPVRFGYVYRILQFVWDKCSSQCRKHTKNRIVEKGGCRSSAASLLCYIYFSSALANASWKSLVSANISCL
jgi:hypothetical protein